MPFNGKSINLLLADGKKGKRPVSRTIHAFHLDRLIVLFDIINNFIGSPQRVFRISLVLIPKSEIFYNSIDL